MLPFLPPSLFNPFDPVHLFVASHHLPLHSSLASPIVTKLTDEICEHGEITTMNSNHQRNTGSQRTNQLSKSLYWEGRTKIEQTWEVVIIITALGNCALMTTVSRIVLSGSWKLSAAVMDVYKRVCFQPVWLLNFILTSLQFSWLIKCDHDNC